MYDANGTNTLAATGFGSSLILGSYSVSLGVLALALVLVGFLTMRVTRKPSRRREG
jgi:hypothetical protein